MDNPEKGLQNEYLGLVVPLFAHERSLTLTKQDKEKGDNICWAGGSALVLFKTAYSPQITTPWIITALFVLARRSEGERVGDGVSCHHHDAFG